MLLRAWIEEVSKLLLLGNCAKRVIAMIAVVMVLSSCRWVALSPRLRTRRFRYKELFVGSVMVK